MNNNERTFDLGIIVSITSGRLFTNINNVYDILSYLTNRTVLTQQIPYLLEITKQYILEKYPTLKGIGEDVPIKNEKDAITFINEQKKIYGENLSLSPMAKEIPKNTNSIEELIFNQKCIGNITINFNNKVIPTTNLEKLEPKEIVTQLHEISNQIIRSYYELIKKIQEGKSLNEELGLITKLKILIIKEEHMIKSIPRNKLLSCRLAIKGEAYFITLDDPAVEYNFEEEDLFEFPKNEPRAIYDRVSTRLYTEQKLYEGEVVSLKEKNLTGGIRRIELGYLDSIMALVDIKLIKSLKEQFEKGYTNIEMNAELNKSLRKKLDVYFILSLMRSHVLEMLTFLFNSSLNIEQSIDTSLSKIESILFNSYGKDTTKVIGNLGELAIDSLSKVDIDVSNSSSALNTNFDTIFEYILNITKLDIILSYSNKDSCKKIESFLNGIIINFKSNTVEQIVREMIKKHKTRILFK